MPLKIIRQDITKMKVDAIVNTTNEEMVGYSGVDLAVHTAAGPELDEACAKIAPLGLGSAKITKGYNLDVKYIIHTSGPVWHGGLNGESIILKSCYLESLKLAVEKGCETVAFPLISSGNYGFPKDQVLRFAVQVITEFLFEHELMVYLCVFDRTSYEFSKKLFDEISEAINDDYVAFEEEMYGRHESLSLKEYGKSLLSRRGADVFGGLVKRRKKTNKNSFKKLLSDRINKEAEEDYDDFSLSHCEDADEDLSDKFICSPFEEAPEEASLFCAEECENIPYDDDSESENDSESLVEYLRSMDKSFAYKLFDYIDAKGMTDVEYYKKANVDKKTFSKIKCNPQTYKPSKQTAVAFAIALELDMEQTLDLLAAAGLTLSRSFTFDKIIRFFIRKGEYDIFVINEALFEFDQMLLGC